MFSWVHSLQLYISNIVFFAVVQQHSSAADNSQSLLGDGGLFNDNEDGGGGTEVGELGSLFDGGDESEQVVLTKTE